MTAYKCKIPKFKLHLFYNFYKSFLFVPMFACVWVVFVWEETRVPRGSPYLGYG